MKNSIKKFATIFFCMTSLFSCSDEAICNIKDYSPKDIYYKTVTIDDDFVINDFTSQGTCSINIANSLVIGIPKYIYIKKNATTAFLMMEYNTNYSFEGKTELWNHTASYTLTFENETKGTYSGPYTINTNSSICSGKFSIN